MNRFALRRSRVMSHFGILSAMISTSASRVSHPSSPMDSEIRNWNKRLTNLIRMGRVNEAHQMFNSMSQRDTVTWNTMMTGYIQRREIVVARNLFDEMPERDKDVVSWNLIISGYVSHHGCGSQFVEEGRTLFDRMPVRDSFSWNTIISGYVKIGRMDVALSLFHAMPEQNAVAWNAIISGFLQNGDVMNAVEWFETMPKKDVSSLSVLVSGLIQNGELDMAARILLDSSLEDNGEKEDLVQAYNTLIVGYGRRGRILEARHLFDHIPSCPLSGGGERGKFVKDVVSWNSMIMCYVKSGDVISARKLFDEMVERDSFSWNTMLMGYIRKLDMETASEFFSCMPNPDAFSWNAMITGHARARNLELALVYFERMPIKNVVSWNSMLAGFESNGKYGGGIKLFMRMLHEGEMPDRHTFSSVLSISSSLVALNFGMQIHQMLTKTFVPDVPVYNALVTMYSRCGAITEARTIFDTAKFRKHVITWNAMIGAYASHGCAPQALQLFEDMKKFNIRPTHRTFTSVLDACAHTGLVKEGQKYFESMKSDFGVEPRVEHFAALVNIFARVGRLWEALALIKSTPNMVDKVVWGALLNACRMHNNVELARVAAEELSRLDPESSAPYVLLYNMYVDLEQWEDATEVRGILDGINVKKNCASSWVSATSG